VLQKLHLSRPEIDVSEPPPQRRLAHAGHDATLDQLALEEPLAPLTDDLSLSSWHVSSENWPEQSKSVVTTKAQRQHTGDWLGKDQALEASDAVGLGETAAAAEAVEVDWAALASLADVYFARAYLLAG
jgi:hypothetical protein